MPPASTRSNDRPGADPELLVVVHYPGGATKTHLFADVTQPIRIGSSAGSQVVIAAPRVRPLHAEIVRAATELRLRDLSSGELCIDTVPVTEISLPHRRCVSVVLGASGVQVDLTSNLAGARAAVEERIPTTRGPGGRVNIVMLAGSHPETFTFASAQEILIGRSRACQISVPESVDGVSRQHCRLSWQRGWLVLEDLDTTNGTWIAGRRTRRAVLRLGPVYEVHLGRPGIALTICVRPAEQPPRGHTQAPQPVAREQVVSWTDLAPAIAAPPLPAKGTVFAQALKLIGARADGATLDEIIETMPRLALDRDELVEIFRQHHADGGWGFRMDPRTRRITVWPYAGGAGGHARPVASSGASTHGSQPSQEGRRVEGRAANIGPVDWTDLPPTSATPPMPAAGTVFAHALNAIKARPDGATLAEIKARLPSLNIDDRDLLQILRSQHTYCGWGFRMDRETTRITLWCHGNEAPMRVPPVTSNGAPSVRVAADAAAAKPGRVTMMIDQVAAKQRDFEARFREMQDEFERVRRRSESALDAERARLEEARQRLHLERRAMEEEQIRSHEARALPRSGSSSHSARAVESAFSSPLATALAAAAIPTIQGALARPPTSAIARGIADLDAMLEGVQGHLDELETRAEDELEARAEAEASWQRHWHSVQQPALSSTRAAERVSSDDEQRDRGTNTRDPGGWLMSIEEPDRAVFRHLAEHGQVDEEEAVRLVGGARHFRRFSIRFEQHVVRCPFRVRIEVGAKGKCYVREG